MKYKKYPSYKDSCVDWLGNVPEHWNINSLKSLLQERKEPNNPIKTKDILSLCMYRGVIPYSEKGNSGNKAKEDLTAYKLAYPGDIVLNSMNVIAGSVGLSKYFGAVSPVYYMLRPRNNENSVEFFNNIFQSESFQKSLFGLGNGIMVKQSEITGKLNTIRMRIPMDKLNTVLMPCPPALEQQQIAKFLDNATQKMDTLIQKQENLIKLLKEKRQAVISHAVTRGLNPDVKFKDSGVEWLGDIPEHWEIKLVKYLLNDKVGIKIGPFGSALKLDDMVKDGYKVYGQENVIKRNFNLGHRFISQSKFESMIIYKIEPEDILITMMGTVGNCIVIPKDIKVGIIDSHLIKIRTNQELITSNYFVNMIDKSNIVKVQLDLFSKGSIMQGLNSSIIKSLIFPMPPVHEQAQILSYIDDKTSKIDTLIEKANKSITLLKEKRTALISAAVTGKIDVREQV